MRFKIFFSETLTAKCQGREGNSPDQRIRSLMKVKCKRRIRLEDSGSVGLEAAICLRTRNSASEESLMSDDVTGLRNFQPNS